jgi:hypothetical protein
MPMDRSVYASGTLLALGLIAAGAASATELRGRVDSRNPQTGYFFPRQGASVNVMAGNGTIVRQAMTGGDGMYYLSHIPPGSYILVVNGIRFALNVANAPSQDVAPVLVP